MLPLMRKLVESSLLNLFLEYVLRFFSQINAKVSNENELNKIFSSYRYLLYILVLVFS